MLRRAASVFPGVGFVCRACVFWPILPGERGPRRLWWKWDIAVSGNYAYVFGSKLEYLNASL
jgi:hypothetical protein